MGQIQLAYNVMKTRLTTGAWSPGERMPPLEELAVLCGVSRGTAWKALKLLQKESLLHTKQRGAIIAGPADAAPVEHSAQGLLWERIKTRLGKEILAGTFNEQFLPPVSKLARRYGVTAHTASKSLIGLVSEGLLVADGLKYRVPRTGKQGYQPQFVLISSGARERGIFISDLRTQSIVESFERECSRLNRSYRSVGYNLYSPTALVDIERYLKETHETAGYILNIWRPWSQTQWTRWLDLLHVLIARNTPLVVIDQAGDLVLPRTLTGSPCFRVLRIASIRAGVMVADFLYKRGHKKITYVTPYFNLEWSRSRYEGLCAYFKRYGESPGGVEHFTLSELADTNDLRLALMGLSKPEIELLYGGSRTREETESLKSALDRVAAMNLPGLFVRDPIAQTLRELVKSILKQIRTGHNLATCMATLATVETQIDEQAMRLYLRPFLLNILKKSAGTAWVCSEERTALNALHFLKTHGKKVPQEISVLGFDNWKDAYEQNLSTYDFNMDGIVKQALLMIMDKKTLKATPVISEVDGYVVERGTTRR
jgi:DNA-binding LacI/PurR family transcriptional regulator/DNA-binding transcriptional regulator YhcF (GntR family)